MCLNLVSQSPFLEIPLGQNELDDGSGVTNNKTSNYTCMNSCCRKCLVFNVMKKRGESMNATR